MLSSDRDGEIVAAANAVGRLLEAAGLDWHDLADAISLPPDRHAPTGNWRDMARECRGNGHRLSAKEFAFVLDMAISEHEPSPKQAAWLRAIFNRVQR